MYIILYIQCTHKKKKCRQFCTFKVHIFSKNVHNSDSTWDWWEGLGIGS